MIKLVANVSKKVPMPEVEFSSQSFSAGMEIEVASGASVEEIQKKLKALYELLGASIDGEIRACQSRSASEKDPSQHGRKHEPARNPAGKGGNGQRLATKAQVKAIYAIAHERGYTDKDIEQLVSESFEVAMPSDLSIGQASELIDTLKGDGKE